MNVRFLLFTALVSLLEGCASTTVPASQRASDECVLVYGATKVQELLAAGVGPTLVYVRADWAAAGVFKNDTYVPSPQFLKTIEGTQCIVGDVTGSGSNELIKYFQSDGIPFFVLLNSDGSKVAILPWGRDFDEFRSWFASAKLLLPGTVK
ncbi:MAG TPA: hypothetical protein VIY48_20815 [Candidatus Paceibacterota bacterium]